MRVGGERERKKNNLCVCVLCVTVCMGKQGSVRVGTALSDATSHKKAETPDVNKRLVDAPTKHDMDFDCHIIISFLQQTVPVRSLSA